MGVLFLVVMLARRGCKKTEGLKGCHASNHVGVVGRRWRTIAFHAMLASFRISNLLAIVKRIGTVPCILVALLINWVSLVSKQVVLKGKQTQLFERSPSHGLDQNNLGDQVDPSLVKGRPIQSEEISPNFLVGQMTISS